MNKITRGAIFYAKLDPIVGSEQSGIRPVLVIQNNVGNNYSPTTIVAIISTKKDEMLPTHVLVKQLEKLRPNSIVLLEQIRTIDKSRLKSYVCNLDEEDMIRVDKAIRIALDIT